VKLGKRIGRIIGFALGAAFVVFVVVQAWFLLHIAYWTKVDPRQTSFMERRLNEMRARDPKAKLDQRWVGYRRISPNLKRAVIAAEDAKFVDHEGFDWDGIQRALERNQKRGKVVAGGSTISQQLAKNLFLSGERSVIRKGQEALITIMLEAVMEKRRILEIYLNVAEWGEGIFGAEAAARHYYGTSAARLSADQAARLAAMLPRPRYYDRNGSTRYLEQYADRIQARMPSAQVP
jgi:monofunctional biosynthetic peptidoglycan transglycosylase